MSVYLVDIKVSVYACEPTDGAKRAGGPDLGQFGIEQAGSTVLLDLGRVLSDRDPKNLSPLSLRQARRTVSNYLRSAKVSRLTGWTLLEATGVLYGIR